MPIETYWFLEDRVSFTRLSGVMTDADLNAMDVWLNACMDTSPAKLIHHIIDGRDVIKPTSARAALKLTAQRHPKMGWAFTIGITRHPMMRFLTALVVSAARIRYRDMTTLDETLSQLQLLDSSLPKLEPYQNQAEASASEQTGS